MSNRRALLIGVPRYDDDGFNDQRLAAAVRADIGAMRAALAQSDYAIEECGIGNADSGGATLSRINRAIEEACATAPAGGEAPEKAVFLRDRLRLYAPLFQLTLPEDTPSAETPVD